MKKQPERTAATRSAFVDAFISISESRPIEKITIQEIADKAGYNRTTFYQYFEDTFHLLSYMEDYIISPLSVWQTLVMKSSESVVFSTVRF